MIYSDEKNQGGEPSLKAAASVKDLGQRIGNMRQASVERSSSFELETTNRRLKEPRIETGQ